MGYVKNNISPWALLTGASSGIGRELAYLFAKDKINLVLSARNEKALNELAEELRRDFGIEVHVQAGDLSKLVEVERILTYLRENKLSIGYLVNNAGFGDYTRFDESDWNRQLDMIQLNITALTYLSRMLIGDMKSRESGMILNIASTAAYLPGPYMAVYFATKAYVLHFSEAIQQELLGTGVSVTTICPGPTESKFVDAAKASDSNLFKNRKMPSSKSVASYAFEKMMKRKGVKIHGWGNFIMANATRFIPRNFMAKIAEAIMRKR